MRKHLSFWVGSVVLLLVAASVLVFGQSAYVVNSLRLDAGSTLYKVIRVSVTFDPAAVNTVTAVAQTVSAAVTGAVIGDEVTVNPRAAVNAGVAMGECFVSAADTVQCVFANPTAGNLDPASQTFDILVTRARPPG